MCYAYKLTKPSRILHKFHILAVKMMPGPKVRCPNPEQLEMMQAEEILCAIDQLKNYKRGLFSMSEVRNSEFLTQSQVHLSQTSEEESTKEMFNEISLISNKQDSSGGHKDNIFSAFIMNSDFSPGNATTKLACNSLRKQLTKTATLGRMLCSCRQHRTYGCEGIR
jgi:hypothetical protein